MTYQVRIKFDLLDYSDLQEALYNGMPFTGVAYSKDGSEIDDITCEVTFVDGIENGPYKSWYSTGELEAEGTRKWGAEDGNVKRYYKSGKINIDSYCVRGRELEKKEFDEDGNLIELYIGNFDLTGKKSLYYPSGNKKCEEFKEFGILTNKIIWDELGNIIEKFTISETSSQYETICRMRKKLGNG